MIALSPHDEIYPILFSAYMYLGLAFGRLIVWEYSATLPKSIISTVCELFMIINNLSS
jgi:hypothetical protein